MKKLVFLFGWLSLGLVIIILFLSLIFKINPFFFFNHTTDNLALRILYISLLYVYIFFIVKYLSDKDFPEGFHTLSLNLEGLCFKSVFSFSAVAVILFIIYVLFITSTGAAFILLDYYGLLFSVMKGCILGFLFALIEEILFRGYILNILLRKYPPFFSMALSSAIFAALHLFRSGSLVFKTIYFTCLFLLGAALCRLFMLTRSLWLPIFVHASWIACLYVFTPGPAGSSSIMIINKNIYNRAVFFWGLENLPTAGILGIIIIFIYFMLVPVIYNFLKTSTNSDGIRKEMA